MVDKSKDGASLPKDAASILERAEASAKELSGRISHSKDHKSTTFAKAQAFINTIQEAHKALLDAASSIYKPPSERKEEQFDEQDTPMPDYDNVSESGDHAANGYYFAILDDIAVESFLGPTFYHLCKRMKDVGASKDKQRTREAQAVQDQELRCPIAGCDRKKKPYKYKGHLDTHMAKKHPDHERRDEMVE